MPRASEDFRRGRGSAAPGDGRRGAARVADLVAAAFARRRLAGGALLCAAALAGCGGGSGPADASASAPNTLLVSVGHGGSVHVALGTGFAETLGASARRAFSVPAGNSATLDAVPANGYRFAAWAGECARFASVACELSDGAIADGATAAAVFRLIRYTFSVSASDDGAVAVAVGGRPAETVPAGARRGFAVTVESSATLDAKPAAHYLAGGWSGFCSGRATTCPLAAGAFTGDADTAAVFAPATYTLSVSAPVGGSVAVATDTGTPTTVSAGARREFAVTVESSATLEAMPATHYLAGGWRGACPSHAGVCDMAAGAFTGDADIAAVFAPAIYTLSVSAPVGGSVAVALGAGASATVPAGARRSFAVTVESSATLEAIPAAHYLASGWRGACPGHAGACDMAAGAFTGDADIAAVFAPATYIFDVSAPVGGTVAVATGAGTPTTVPAGARREFAVTVESPATLEATAAEHYRFAGWTGPCRGLAAACGLAAGTFVANTSDAAIFEPVERALAVGAGVNGAVRVAIAGAGAETVPAGAERAFSVTVESSATLAAGAGEHYAFAGWTGECAGRGAECALVAGAFTADASASAAFAPATYTLTVTAAGNGSLALGVGGTSAAVAAGASGTFAVTVENSATLKATAAEHYRFAGWTGECAAQPVGVCELPPGAFTAESSIVAGFAPVVRALAVSAGANGAVRVAIGAGAATVPTGAERAFSVTVESSATLAAVADERYAFTGWTGECAGRGAECALVAGAFTADASATATFAPVTYTLTVSASDGGSASVFIGGEGAGTVAAGSSGAFAVTVEDSAVLSAAPADLHIFSGWHGACSGVATACWLPTGAMRADASARAEFADSFAWSGPGAVSLEGGTLVAVPHAPGAFIEWQGEPCDGSTAPSCGFRSPPSGADTLIAAFHPFVAHGIKTLLFGLSYHGDAPDHFRILFGESANAGFVEVPGLDELLPGPAPAPLAVSVHLFPWGQGSYATEACDGADACAMANGGERVLAQADSLDVIGYFKAPNAGDGDGFGGALALSGDGQTLAVGAEREDSSATGAAQPSDARWSAALDSGGAEDSGGAYVYHRSATGRWTVEAFVKAPVAGDGDGFGGALALSADGRTLAVGAEREDSSATGAAHPSDARWSAALDSGGAEDSGGAYVYRRSATGRWTVEAFVKAPVAGADDRFGGALALSADGATLALGAPAEDSAQAGAFAPADAGWPDALGRNDAEDSGAAYVYRRSATGRWTVEAFVKAPVAGADDRFSGALALSGDGATLAVGAPAEDGAQAGAFAPADAGWPTAAASDDAPDSGAAYVYRRSPTGRWTAGTFFKAPNAGVDDRFGGALALSADGRTLAVGAALEDSAGAGAYTPAGPGYWAALNSNDADDSGGAYVYHRSASERWTAGAFVKAPNAGADDRFGGALALSADGRTLAVGAELEDSPATGALAPADPQYDVEMAGNDANDSGGAYAYRRTAAGSWTLGNFVKAPSASAADRFGGATALSAEGGTLAVGAGAEGAGAQPQPRSGAGASAGAAAGSGAVYLY